MLYTTVLCHILQKPACLKILANLQTPLGLKIIVNLQKPVTLKTGPLSCKDE